MPPFLHFEDPGDEEEACPLPSALPPTLAAAQPHAQRSGSKTASSGSLPYASRPSTAPPARFHPHPALPPHPLTRFLPPISTTCCDHKASTSPHDAVPLTDCTDLREAQQLAADLPACAAQHIRSGSSSPISCRVAGGCAASAAHSGQHAADDSPGSDLAVGNDELLEQSPRPFSHTASPDQQQHQQARSADRQQPYAWHADQCGAQPVEQAPVSTCEQQEGRPAFNGATLQQLPRHAPELQPDSLQNSDAAPPPRSAHCRAQQGNNSVLASVQPFHQQLRNNRQVTLEQQQLADEQHCDAQVSVAEGSCWDSRRHHARTPEVMHAAYRRHDAADAHLPPGHPFVDATALQAGMLDTTTGNTPVCQVARLSTCHGSGHV